MRNAGRAWWAGLVLLLAWGCDDAWGAQATLVADAHVNSAQPAVNSGALSNLNVGGGYASLVQFGLGMLPVGTTAAQVSRAILLLYCNRADTPGPVTVAPASADWGEYSVTYATMPSLGSAAATATVSAAGQYVALDVTGIVQGWVASPATNYGLALSAATTASVQFDSKENDETGHAPTLEIMLAGQEGPQGLQGPAGPAGPSGATGPQGPTGLVGSQGPAGVPGPAGPKGDMGSQGIQGTPGISGAQGPAGPAGPAGATGPAGSQGPQGPVGMTFRGGYEPTMVYAPGDGVLYGGAAYVSLAAGNIGNVPDENPAVWSMFASGGAGPAGPQGATGPQGSAGPAGPAGATGLTGPAGPQGLQGAPGLAGPQGVAGAAGMRFRGAWDAGVPYAANDAVSFNGSTYLAAASNAAEQPDMFPAVWVVMAAAGGTGPAGPSGPAGQAATISIGSVATGPAGSLATVTNSGTSAAAVLNFVIPQGATGTGGTTGGNGTASALPVSVYHAVSFSYTFYSLSAATSSADESAPVLTWMPQACTATSLQVYSQQTNAIAVRLRQGAPGAMADTALACTAALGNSCTATGEVVIPAGSFVDVSVTGADGTPAAVWTALGCS